MYKKTFFANTLVLTLVLNSLALCCQGGENGEVDGLGASASTPRTPLRPRSASVPAIGTPKSLFPDNVQEDTDTSDGEVDACLDGLSLSSAARSTKSATYEVGSRQIPNKIKEATTKLISEVTGLGSYLEKVIPKKADLYPQLRTLKNTYLKGEVLNLAELRLEDVPIMLAMLRAYISTNISFKQTNDAASLSGRKREAEKALVPTLQGILDDLQEIVPEEFGSQRKNRFAPDVESMASRASVASSSAAPFADEPLSDAEYQTPEVVLNRVKEELHSLKVWVAQVQDQLKIKGELLEFREIKLKEANARISLLEPAVDRNAQENAQLKSEIKAEKARLNAEYTSKIQQREAQLETERKALAEKAAEQAREHQALMQGLKDKFAGQELRLRTELEARLREQESAFQGRMKQLEAEAEQREKQLQDQLMQEKSALTDREKKLQALQESLKKEAEELARKRVESAAASSTQPRESDNILQRVEGRLQDYYTGLRYFDPVLQALTNSADKVIQIRQKIEELEAIIAPLTARISNLEARIEDLNAKLANSSALPEIDQMGVREELEDLQARIAPILPILNPAREKLRELKKKLLEADEKYLEELEARGALRVMTSKSHLKKK